MDHSSANCNQPFEAEFNIFQFRTSAPVWPDVGIKSSQIFSKTCKKVAKTVFTYKVTFFKKPLSCTIFGLLLYENLLSNLVALVARGGRWLRSCRLDISCPIDTQKVTSCLLRRPKVVLGQSMFSFSSIDYIGTYIEKHTYPYYPYHLPSERIGSYLLPRKRSNDI